MRIHPGVWAVAVGALALAACAAGVPPDVQLSAATPPAQLYASPTKDRLDTAKQAPPTPTAQTQDVDISQLVVVHDSHNAPALMQRDRAVQQGSSTPLPYERFYDPVLARSPAYAQDHTVYLIGQAGSDQGQGGCYFARSTDGGSTWAIISGAPCPAMRIVFSPNFPQDSTMILDRGSSHLPYTSGDGIYRSTDGGVTWHALISNHLFSYVSSQQKALLRTGIVPLANPPFDGTIVRSPTYALDHTLVAYGVNPGELAISKDGSYTWRWLYFPPCTVMGVFLSAHFADDTTLLVECWASNAWRSYTGIYRSTDGGVSWDRSDHDSLARYTAAQLQRMLETGEILPILTPAPRLPAPQSTTIATAMATATVMAMATYPPAASDVLDGWDFWPADRVQSPAYSTDHTVFSTDGDFLIRSTDAGDTWRRIGALPFQDGRDLHLFLSPVYLQDQTLYLIGREDSQDSQACSLFRSADGGASWRKLDAPCRSSSLYVSPDFAQNASLLMDRYDYGQRTEEIYRSSDGGDTWAFLTLGRLSAYPSDRLRALAYTGVAQLTPTPTIQAEVDAPALVSVEYWDALRGQRSGALAYRQDLVVVPFDRWPYAPPPCAHGALCPPTPVPTLTPAPLSFRSSWGDLRRDPVACELARSTDGQQTWQPVTGVPCPIFGALASPFYAQDRALLADRPYIHPSDQAQQGIYRSADSGATWTHVTTNHYGQYTRAQLSTLVHTGALPAVAPLLFSTPEAGDWKVRSPSYDQDHVVFAYHMSGSLVLRSDDGGQRWQVVGVVSFGGAIHSLTLSPNFAQDQTIYVSGGSPYDGSYTNPPSLLGRSNDGGRSWFPLTALPCAMVDLHLSPDFARDSALAATCHNEEADRSANNGIYRSTDGGASWDYLAYGELYRYTPEQQDAIARTGAVPPPPPPPH